MTVTRETPFAKSLIIRLWNMCMIIMTLVNDCQMFKLRCPERKLAKNIRRLPFSEGIKMLYNYVYLHCTGIAGKLKTLLYEIAEKNAETH